MRFLGYLAVGACTGVLAAALTGAASLPPIGGPMQSVEDLSDKLNSDNARTRREAVTDLAEIDSEAAWEAIIDQALGDQEAQVADEAQLQLGAATASEALFEALGSKKALRARSVLVRERSVEALGRIDGAVPIGLFAGALKDKEASVRAAAAYALEQRAERGESALDLTDSKDVAAVRKALSKSASSDRDDRARANAIVGLAAFSRVDEGSIKLAEKAIVRGDKSSLLRAASLLASAETNTLEDLKTGLLDEDHGVAMVAIRLLERRGNSASVQALSAALPGDGIEGTVERPAVTAEIVSSLREASGLSYGVVRDRWIRWAEGLDDGWKREAATQGGKSGKEADAGSTTFYGLRLDSDRLVFMVDMSGSMWDKNGATSRKAQVEVELAKALRSLPETAMFNVIPYANDPGPWEKELVPATKRNVEKAVQWFERNTQRGRGDLWRALVPALRDPSIDTVVILSDGAPSGGDRWNLSLWRWLLQDENRLRGTVVHIVMFDGSSFLKKAWKDVVGDWGGAQQLID